jgi:O-antigen ligase
LASAASIPTTPSMPAKSVGPVSATLLTVAALLAVLSWVEPNHYDPWTAFQSQLAMATGALLFAAWLLVRTLRAGPITVPALACAALAAAAVPWIQFQLGIIFFFGDAWITSLYLLGLTLAVVVGARTTLAFGITRLLDTVYGVVLAGGFLSAWIGLYQWLKLDYLGDAVIANDLGDRIVANVAQSNQLATLLVCAALAVGWLHLSRRIGGAVAAAAIAFLFITMPLTGSRTGALMSLGVVVLLLVAPGSRDRTLRPSIILAGVSAAALGATMGLAGVWLFSENTATVRSLESTTSAGTRPIHWTSMVDAITRRPWEGHGWNQVIVAHQSVAADHPKTGETLSSSHNLFLDLLVQNGIPLGLLAIAVLAVSLALALRNARTAVGAFAAAPIVAISMHSMVEFPHEYATFLVVLGLLFGGLLSLSASRRQTVRVPSWVALALVGVVGSMLVVTSRDYFNIEVNYQTFRYEQARIGVDKPSQPLRPVLALTQLSEFLRFARTEARAGMSAQELLWFEHVAKRYPNWTALIRWASALAQNGQPERARAALAGVCHTHPETVCTRAQAVWKWLGRDTPAVAAVPWPTPPTQSQL